mgnify:FL=1
MMIGESMSLLDDNSQKGSQLNGLLGGDNRALEVVEVELQSSDFTAAQVDSIQRGVQQLDFSQIAIGKFDGLELSFAQVCLLQRAAVK